MLSECVPVRCRTESSASALEIVIPPRNGCCPLFVHRLPAHSPDTSHSLVVAGGGGPAGGAPLVGVLDP
jgi:hypothetical protein